MPLTLPNEIKECVLWLSADDLAGADASDITTWVDRSIKGNNATQSTAGNKPHVARTIFTSSRSNKVVARFNSGAEEHLQCADADSLDHGTGGFHFFVLCSFDGTGSTDTLLSKRTHDDDYQWRKGSDDTMDFLAGSTRDGTQTVPTGAFHLFEVRRIGGVSVQLFYDGAVDGTDNASLSRDIDNAHDVYIGLRTMSNGSFQQEFDGDISEVIIFNRDLSAEDQAKVWFYIQERHNLPLDTIGSSQSCSWAGGRWARRNT